METNQKRSPNQRSSFDLLGGLSAAADDFDGSDDSSASMPSDTLLSLEKIGTFCISD